MRRLLLFTIGFTLVLSLVPGAQAGVLRYLSADKDLVSLTRGKGVAALNVRGVIYGSFVAGRIRVNDRPGGVLTTVRVWGEDRVVRVDARTKIYIGTEVRFRIERGAWRARVQGREIYASAVLKGVMTLSNGKAGTYSIEGSTPRRWPVAPRTLRLGD